MKKFILVVPMILGIVSVAFSQNWFVGAGANFSFTTDSMFDASREREIESENRNFSISPEIGYKFEVLDFGIRPIFQYSYRSNDDKSGDSNFSIDKSTDFGFGLGLFSRYKFITFFDKLSIFGRLDANYIFSKGQREYEQQIGTNNQSRKTEIIQQNAVFGISPVIEFRLTDRFSLYSSIIGSIVSIRYSYSSENITTGNGYSSDRHSLNLTLPSVYNLSITDYSIGFYVTF